MLGAKRWDECIETIVQGSRVEELFQLFVENAELFNKLRRVIRAWRCDSLEQPGRRLQILRSGAAMELILKCSLNLSFQFRGNIVSMGDITNPCQRLRPLKGFRG